MSSNTGNLKNYRPLETPWHSLDASKVMEQLDAHAEGISEEEVNHRQSVFGKNKLPESDKTTLLRIIWHQLINPLIFILIAAAVASVAIGEGKDAIFIFIVILLNTVIGAYQEYNAEKSASGLQQLMRIQAKVKRSGSQKTIDSEELVPGDIVLLETGMKVPADLRLHNTQGLEIDESFLTGESQAILKHTDAVAEERSIGDRLCMAFAGSTVMSGRATGVVVKTAKNTQVGQIAENVSTGESAKPPLIVRMERFTKQISYFIIGLSVVLAVLLRVSGEDPAAIFFFVVALAVSAIPEGLPVSLTVALSVAVRKMAKKNVIVRQLTAVESLGSCTVIASDKTGTLTVNQQTAKKIILADGTTVDIAGEGYNGLGHLSDADGKELSVHAEDKDAKVYPLIKVATLANEGQLEKNPTGEWEHQGDAMDVALLGMTYKSKLTPDAVLSSYSLLSKIPYESENKFSGAFYKDTHQDSVQLGVKGAVETILSFCDLGKSDAESITKQADQMAAQGYRVLGFAEGSFENYEQNKDYGARDISGLSFVGLVCFIDPLRSEAITSVEKCKEAGIKVIMITGDHPATAGNIAKELGIAYEGDQAVVSGMQLEELKQSSQKAYEEAIVKGSVFARVSPLQKLEIVDVLIEKGEFVAVTGDGVNDAPALKRANIGVAMGSGTDVAKEVGSMIVVDDNFASIVAGVEEGRHAYANVRKVIYLLVSTGAAEVVMFLMAIAFGLPLPLLAVQLLWLNLVTNGIQDKALAFEKGEATTMQQKPRNPKDGIFDTIMVQQLLISGLVIGLIAFGLWFYLNHFTDMDELHARNLILLLMVFMQNVHIFNCRSEYQSTFKISLANNMILIALVAAAQLLHIASMYIPFMQNILRVEPITLGEWATILLLAIPIVLVMEVFKWFKRRSYAGAVKN
ncbi:MAG: HAD-IC family P-type ATPase [Cyclobacteriaceae bacterium]|nr:HAD-IC family P-type ATPase [Cyclobacteriaceae bacterium]MCH8515931.1 HAD-IC family P-type ATPase [Cyclobacteriaceae bacterium]